MSNADIKQITISTSLLEAVARWALPESENSLHLSQIVFRDGEVIAVDGCRLVRVPINTNGLTFGLRRADAFAAVAAQDAMAGRYVGYARGSQRPSSKTLRIERRSGGLGIFLGDGARPVMVVEETDLRMFPPIEEVMPRERRSPPDGIGFNPRYLAGIDEVVSVLTDEPTHRSVQVTSHGHPLDPTLFEGPGGSRFVVMPTKQT
jgi:hypothetical protein